MSVSLLFEVRYEARRLLIAGSEFAAGGFRLKRLLPQLKKAGESAPVFSRLATAVEKVIESGADQAPASLLELVNIVNAVLYTQGETGLQGDMEDLDTAGIDLNTSFPYRKLQPVIEALTVKGAGRLEKVRAAHDEGLFQDTRLVYPLLDALDDSYPDISGWALRILAGQGEKIVPVLLRSLDFRGGRGQAGRIKLLAGFMGPDGKELYLEALEKGSVAVRISAITAIQDLPECEEILVELSKDKKKEIREAALLALSNRAKNAETKVNDAKDNRAKIKGVRKWLQWLKS